MTNLNEAVCTSPRVVASSVWGYESFLEAIADPKHPEYADYIEWIGDDFDPEAFDMEEVNERLKPSVPE